MAEQKPDFPEGYVGPQEGFTAAGLKSLSHENPTIIARENVLEIKFLMPKSYRFTHQLIKCRTETVHNEFVFVQTKEGHAIVEIQFPETGWFKLQLYGVPVADTSKALPNIFNYVIHCTRAMHPIFPYPKQYAQWKDGCYISEPKHLHRDMKLTNIIWRVNVPKAKSVAVIADGKWFHFEKKGGPVFEAKFSLDHLRDKNAKITLNANFEADEVKFLTLLEYNL